MVPAYILGGGKSSRFGSDKAQALVEGTPLILHVARAVAPRASRITVVAEVADKYRDWGLHTIGDALPGLGPLGGLLTALRDLRSPGWLLLLPCDLLGLQVSWIDQLLSPREGSHGQAIAFRGQRWEPLVALYRDTCLREVEALVAQGSGALWRVLDRVATVALPLPMDWDRARHINTQSDLIR